MAMIGPVSQAQTYCASNATSTFDEEILNVTVGILNNSSTCTTLAPGPGSILNQYSNYTTLPATPLPQGTSVSLSLTLSTCNGDYSNAAAIYIDYNQNGFFTDIGEQVYLSPASAIGTHTETGSFVVPTTALTGVTRMRVVQVETGSPFTITSCGTYSWGETEDYSVEIVIPVACTGVPTAITATATPSTVCAGTPITIFATGAAGNIGGLAYTLESSAPGAGMFTTVSGPQPGPSFNIASQSVTTDYRIKIKCTATGDSLFSNIVTVTNNSFVNCYCTSSATTTFDEEILNVTVGILNNSSTCSTLAPGPGSVASQYSNYTTLPPTPLPQGTSVSFSLGLGTCGGFNYNNAAAIYIDYNHNGLFTDAGEQVYVATVSVSGAHTESGSFIVPLTADTGITRMRVVQVETFSPTTITPCGTYGYGETEDYLVNVVIPVACTGTPTTLNATANPTVVCAGTPITISAIGAAGNIGGYLYTLQTSAIGAGVFSTVAGPQPGPSFNIPSQTVGTDYRIIIKCTATNDSTISNAVTVNQNPFFNCYCTSTATSNFDEDILNVTVGLLNNTSTCTSVAPGPGSVAGQYSNYTTLAPTALPQGTSVSFSIGIGQCNNGNYTNGFKIYIDYNHNGLFTDAGDNVYTSVGNQGAYTETGNFIVPLTADTGVTRMRIIVLEGGPTGINPCGNYTWGETEDYLVNVVIPVPCSGVPTSLVATASNTNVCVGTPTTFSATGAAGNIGGYLYTLQSSAPGAGVFNIIAGPQPGPSFTVASQSTTTDYRIVITCTATGDSAVSNTVTVTQNTFLDCYCTSAAQFNGDEEILGVTVGPLNNVSTCTTLAPGPGSVASLYSNYTTLPPTPLPQGATVPFSLDLGTCGGFGYPNSAAIYIDYNHNGLFTDPGEQVYLSPGTTSGAHIESGSFLIPLSADTGVTRMRVIQSETNPASITPCGLYFYGETEDYFVNIIIATPCNGATPAIAATANDTSVCVNQTFTITVTGAPAAVSGLTYQLQSSVSGANAFSYIGAPQVTPTFSIASQSANTDYRVVVKCVNTGDTGISNTVIVTNNPFMDCLCPSQATTGGREELLNVTFGTLNNTSTCFTLAPGPGSIASQYSNYMTLTPPGASQGTTVSLSLQIGDCSGSSFNNATKVFIDYNQNGVFTDPGEEVYVSATSTAGPHTETGTVLIPLTAMTGNTVMRVVNQEVNTPIVIMSCGTYTYGETEDYLVNILPGCLAPDTAFVTAVTATTATLNWTAAAGAAGYEYTVNTTATAPVAAGTPTTATQIVAFGPLLPATTYYLHVRTNCGTSMSLWKTVSFTTTCPPPTALSVSNLTASGATFNWGGTTGVAGYEYVVDQLAGNPTGAGTPTTTTSGFAAGLNCGEDYFVHVRTNCGTTFSSWITTTFTTLCPTPNGLSATNISTSGADINWNSNSCVSGYEYVLDQSSANPSGAGQAITGTNYMAGALTSSVTYFFHLRAECGNGFSQWVTISFTPLCAAPSNLLAANINSNSADLSWGGVPGAAGYEYVVNQSAASPTAGTNGTAISNTFFTAGNLSFATTYYLHVRTNCGSGFSVWVTIPFTTLVPNCDPPIYFSAINVNSTSAYLSWNTVVNATGYEYLIDQNALVPTVAGTFTTDTGFTATNLLPNASYFLHVRSNCGGGNLTVWHVGSFSTDATGIMTLNNSKDGFIWQVYPNPVNSELNVQVGGANSTVKATIQLTDVSGRILMSQVLQQGNAKFVMSELAAGTYFVRYIDETRTRTIPVVKQ